MQKTKHWLMTIAALFALVMNAYSFITITDVNSLSDDKFYHISQPYHSYGITAWAVDNYGTELKSTNELGIEVSNTDFQQQFTFIHHNGERYLYHLAQKKYIDIDGSLNDFPNDPVFFKDGAYENTFVAYFDNSHYINVDGNRELVINSWKTSDGGNSCRIVVVGFQINGINYHITSSSTVEVISGNNYEGDIIIPSYVSCENNTYEVTSIGDRAFLNSKITSITIPDNVTKIGEYAFDGCKSLSAITIGKGLIVMPLSALEGCDKIEKAILDCSKIDNWFSGIGSLREVELGNNVTGINASAFKNCTGLRSISISSNVSLIGTCAFDGCTSLTSIILPQTLTSIHSSTFSGCSKLTSVTIPENVTSIGTHAFAECSSLTDITIPNNVISIGYYAFSGCASLMSITIPNNMTQIESSTFSGCGNLTSVSIPESITSIGTYAFSNCSSLTSITIPNSITSIGNSAFDNCTSLKEFIIEDGSETLTLSYNSYNSSTQGEGLFHDCPLEYVYLGRTLSYNTDKKYGYTPFYEKQSLKSLVVGDKVTSMRSTTINTSHSGSTAFTGCGNLISIAVSEGNTTYDSRDNCNAIIETSSNTLIFGCSSTAVPWNTTSIGYSAFYKCSGLTSITLPRNLKTIGTSAFFGCSGLSSIVIPEYVTSVSSSAFSGCTNLKSVVIPASVTSVSYGAFKDCSKIASIICNATTPPTGGDSNTFLNVDKSIPVYVPLASVSSYQKATYWKDFTNIIGTTAAGTCGEGLTWILIDGELIIEGEGAMNNFSSGYAPWANYGVSKITIKDGVTSIGNSAFYYLRSLTSVSIPESVQTIGSNAFAYCERLRSIVIPEGVTTIGDGAFVTCDVLSSVTIPSTLTKIGSAVFANNCRYRSVKISSLEAWCNISFWGSYSNPLDCDGGGTLILNGEVITDLVIPNTVTEIKSMAFCGCDDITSITIPESVKKIGSSALACYPTTIICKTMTPPTCDRYSFTNVGKSIPVYVPLGTLDAYQAADGWSEFANIQVKPETLTINQYGSGTYCSEYALDFSEMEGLKAYAATGYDTETGVVTLSRVMTAKAGVGLFIKGEPGDYVVPVLESTSFNTLNMLVGTLEQTELNGLSSDGLYANYKYTVVEGEKEPLFHPFADGSTLSAGKAYLQIPVAWLPQGEARAISYRFDEGTTSIDEEQLANDNDLPAEIYDLMGRRVAVPQKGSLYIINNEKVIY